MKRVGGKLGVQPVESANEVTQLPVTQSTDHSALAEIFLEKMDVQPQSREVYRRHLKQFLLYLEERKIKTLTRDSVLEYKRHLVETCGSPYTIRNYLLIAASYFSHLYPNIPLRIRGIKIEQGHRRDPLTVEQIHQLFNSIGTEKLIDLRDLAILKLLVHNGLRSIEVVRANVGDLRLHSVENEYVLWVQGKGHLAKDAVAVIVPTVYSAIMEYLGKRGSMADNEPLFGSCSDGDGKNKSRRLSTRSLRRMFRLRLEAAGIKNPRIKLHSTRNSAINLSLKATNNDLIASATLARHKNVQTTVNYSNVLRRIKDAPEKKIEQFLAQAAKKGQ